MTRILRLPRVLKAFPALTATLDELAAARRPIVVRDERGSVLYGKEPGTADQRGTGEPILVDGRELGRVEGDVAPLVAALVSSAAGQLQLNRTLGREILDLYRHHRVIADLTAMLADAEDPADVAAALVGAVPRTVGDCDVSFDPTSARATAAPADESGEVTILNGEDRCELRIQVVGAERRFGTLVAVRPGPDFTASDADLVSTLAVLSAAAFGRASAHQRALRASEERSRELEATVERLRSELDLATVKVLATVVFTDIVDSTATQSRLGDEAWARVIEAHNREAARLVESAGGTLVEFTGDGFFGWFDSPSRALACATSFRSVLGELGLGVRIGVHTGEVEQRGRRVSGLAVNIAARVMALAGDGEVLVSSVTAEVLRTGGLTFEARPATELKGVPGTWVTLALVG